MLLAPAVGLEPTT